MSADPTFEIFLVTAPGLETVLALEVRKKGFSHPKVVPGGVAFAGSWPDVWRANLEIRGATRVLARFAQFHAEHLSQLDKRARRVPWAAILRKDIAVRVEASCKSSRIYHSGAAAERVARAISEELGAPISDEADLCVRVRIEKDAVTLAVDTSGELLHKRGHKEAVSKAPMRETLAALFLSQCGYVGREPIVDPMCGSGTFVIEAAEICAGLKPGRARTFAFETLATFDAAAWDAMRASEVPAPPPFCFHGSDRDAGAVRMAQENASRAGVAAWTEFSQSGISDCRPPEGPKGLVILNPPYGTRIGEKKSLVALYRAIGATLKAHFSGWRAGIITADENLAQATGLPFLPPSAPVSHGGLRVVLYRTRPLS